MTTTGARAGGIGPSRPRWDRTVLLSNVISGAGWVVGLALLSWPLALVGAAYVAAGSVVLAACYAHDAPTRRREALAWATPWVAAVALWTWMFSGVSEGLLGRLLSLVFAAVIATLCYLAWQLSALAVRQVLMWRSRGSSEGEARV